VRALALPEASGRLVLTELPDPRPHRDQALVRVHAASINPVDVRVCTGRYPWGRYDYPVVPGFDFAGTVEDIGPDVVRLKRGDEVLGYWSAKRFHRGSWAEYLTVPESAHVAVKPRSVPFDLAAAAPLAAVTALMCVDAVLPLSGETVLIVGAGGAIGSYVVQLAAAAGATVLATGRAAQRHRLRDIGATHVIDYLSQDIVAAVSDLQPAGVAALIDLANELPEVTRLSALVRNGGRVASACFGADPDLLAQRGIASANVVATHAEPTLLVRLAELLESGAITAAYDELRPLDDVPAAVQEISRGPSRKTVIAIHPGLTPGDKPCQ
jgi:NADPH:quinone reductase-like Zn-dependent oxidoreductase